MSWNCAVCNRAMHLSSKAAHLSGRRHIAKAAQASKQTEQLPLHPNGKRYIPLWSVAEIHNHLCEIPVEAYTGAGVRVNGRSTMVTVEDVEAASDAWDARGLLHDIDTQWGLMPWGGAYKESDQYFGPGEYDFY